VSEGEPVNSITMDEANRQALLLEMPIDGGAFFERTDFNRFDILVQLQQLFLDEATSPEAVEFLRV
jgi:hypothetical protein